MSVPGDIVEVRVQSRGSQLVGDHTSGASSIVVANPTDFDTAGGMLRIDGTVYAWTSVTLNGTDDEATATLAITPNLAANEPDTMPVELWSGAQVIDDVVLTVDAGGDTPAYVSLRSDQRKDWTAREGYLEPPVPATFSNDFSVLLDADGYTPTLDAATLTGDLPDAATVAVTAPATSPAFTVRGFASGLQVLTDAVPPSVLLDFYVDGTLALANQRSNFVALLSNAAGSPMTSDALTTTYAVTVVAHNAAGSAAASGPVSGSRDLGYPDATWFYQLLVNVLTAQTATIGGMAFGQDGITIFDSTGKVVVRLPSDGSGPTFAGQGNFDSIQVARLLVTGALNYLQGTLFLANGVTDPTDKPNVVAAGWDTHTIATANPASTYSGLYYDTTNWVIACSASSAYSVGVYSVATGAAVTGTFMPGGFRPVGGVTKIGTSWYVLGQDDTRAGAWYVYVFNASWVKTSEWAVPINLPNGGAIGQDGSNVLIGRVDGGGTIRVTVHTPSTGTVTSTVTGPAWSGTVTSVTKTSTGFAAARYVLSTASAMRVLDTSGNRQAADEWPLAATAYGMTHDGTQWRSFDGAKVSDYTNLAGSYDFAYSYATPGSSWETGPSAIRQITLQRQKWTITGSAPTDASVTAVRVYAAIHGASVIRQATLTASPWSQTFSTLLTSGTGTASNNYPAGNAGIVRTSTGKLSLKGDDTYALNGTWTLETSGTLTAITGLAVSYRVVNGKVRVKCTTTGTPTIATGTTTVATGTLPAGLRPATIETGSAVCQGQAATLRVNTDGTVSVIQNNAASRNTCDGNVEYDRP